MHSDAPTSAPKPHRDGGRTTTTTTGLASVAPGAGITPELLDTRDAARLLGIGERTLWRWSRSGVCPEPIRLGRGLRAAVRYRRTELLDWIADGCPRMDGKGGNR